MAKRPTLADVNPELVQWWHPSHNGDRTPDDVSPSWRKPVWWTCPQGHAYQATVHARVRGASCPLCRPDNSSAAEQWLATALRNHFPDTVHRHTLSIKGGPVEVDLFIPQVGLAIEYDGPHHRHRVKADNKKNFILRRAGVPLLRIRQLGLPPMEDAGIHVIHHDTEAPNGLELCVNQVLHWIHA